MAAGASVPRVEHQRLWEELRCQGSGRVAFDELVTCYGARRRSYHTLRHVVYVLDRIEEIIRAQAECSWGAGAVRWAAWYHDAVMTFGTGQNDERQSAELAARAAGAAGLGNVFCGSVRRLVMVTNHSLPVVANDEAVLVDADLAILGASPAEFDEYERAVRFEWPDVAEADFARVRAEILDDFLKREHVFVTAFARGAWEKRAQENLTRSIAALRRKS